MLMWIVKAWLKKTCRTDSEKNVASIKLNNFFMLKS